MSQLKEGDIVVITDDKSAFYRQQGELYKRGNGSMWSVQFKGGYDVYFNENQLTGRGL